MGRFATYPDLGKDVEVLLEIQRDGKCVGINPKFFFPEEGESYQTGIKICALCPIRIKCAEYALRNHEHGLWGGLTPNDRKTVRKARNGGEKPIEVTKHGNGTASFRNHLKRGEYDCEQCFQTYAENVNARVIVQTVNSRSRESQGDDT